MKKLTFAIFTIVTAFLFLNAVTLQAQEVVLTDEFDSGDGLWSSGWIDAASATATFSIDNTGLLSGANSYKGVIARGSVDTYRIQRNANCALVAGYEYTLSFKAVADSNATINVLFEISGDPYTKRINEIANVTTVPQTFTYTMTATENVPTNMVKLHYGGVQNNGRTIWVDSIVVTRIADPSLITQWGKASGATNWPVINSTAPGEAGLGGISTTPTAWASIRGAFPSILEATTDQAVVVSGKMELVGGGGASLYTWLRYALINQDSVILNNAGTDTAIWVCSGTNVYSGYSFHPRSGTGTMSNGNGGSGTVWRVENSGWNSSYGLNWPISAVKQAPRNAIAAAGIYDFAVSVKSIDDTTNEVRWSLIKTDNSYWFGGTIQTKSTTKQFNGVMFGFNTIEATRVNFTGVKAKVGDPIVVPTAPWQAFYVDAWGETDKGRNGAVLWQDTTGGQQGTIVGDAGIDLPVRTGDKWATIRGAFGDPVEITTDKAIIVSGQMEFIGGGGASGYTWLRYALSNLDSAKLINSGSDTAEWIHVKANKPDSLTLPGSYGYIFTPISGTGTMSNTWRTWPEGNQGTAWLLNNGSWTSTNNNGGGPISKVKNAPRNAAATAGTYNWAISVKSVNDTTNEVAWYLIKTDDSYWFGGKAQTKATTKQFNGICFGFNSDMQATQVNFIAVKVDLGNTITVPEAPWQAFYVDTWGKTVQGKNWPILNDSTYLVGDASLGSGAAPGGWATIRGGFGDPIGITTDKAIIVSGQLEFVGGGGASQYTWMRYALTYMDSSKLKYALTDTAEWDHTIDSLAPKTHFGYAFHPRTGTGTMSNGNGGSGTVWRVENGSWASSYGSNWPISAVRQAPRNAIATAGTYDWAISVKSVNDTTNEIAWYFIKTDNSYWFGGTVQAKSTAKQFNGINFGFNDGEATRVNLLAVKVDLGESIDVPIAPWQEYYVSDWGILGSRYGGWTFQADPEGIVGNAGIGGTAANTGWAVIRAAFDGTTTPTVERPLLVTGEVEFVGGGFEAPSSFRLGLFQNDNAGNVVVDATPANGDSTRWSGSEVATSGYLFVPTSGTNAMVSWNGVNSKHGTYGAIVNDIWMSTGGANTYALGSNLQTPANAVGGAGTYNFAISVTPTSEGANIVRYSLKKGTDYVLAAGAMDNVPVATKFNGIIFGLNANTSTTAMMLTNVLVDTGSVAGIDDITDVTGPNARPREFALCQNYPNPFNPSTMIQYDIPMNSQVTLTVYDILGRAVAKLVDEKQTASTYTVQWNASNMSSGVYFYRINAKSEDGSKTFTSVKKLLLMK